jgi:hypothetical protein
VNVRVNREHKVKAIGQVAGASAQQNRALSIRQFAPELHCIDLAWPRHTPIIAQTFVGHVGHVVDPQKLRRCNIRIPLRSYTYIYIFISSISKKNDNMTHNPPQPAPMLDSL